MESLDTTQEPMPKWASDDFLISYKTGNRHYYMKTNRGRKVIYTPSKKNARRFETPDDAGAWQPVIRKQESHRSNLKIFLTRIEAKPTTETATKG